VITKEGASEHGVGERIPEHPALPGLAPKVDDLFAQVIRQS